MKQYLNIYYISKRIHPLPTFQLASHGTLLIEAEDLTAGIGSSWSVLSDVSASGHYTMVVAPDYSPANSAGTGKLSLQLDVATPGTYYLSLRGAATGLLTTSNPLSVALDGTALASSTRISPATHGDEWTTTPLVITITTAGLHTIDLGAQQPGFALDEVALSDVMTMRPGARQAKASSEFIDAIGVDAHMSWLDSRYSDVAAVKSALQYLGVRNVRDSITSDAAAVAFNSLADAGIKFDFFMPQVSPVAAPGQVLEWGLQLVKDHAWMTRFIEGPNEVDFWPVVRNGLTGYAAADATQRDLYALVKADSVLSNFPVLQFTIGDYANYAAQTDMSAYADFGNIHSYTGDADAPGLNVGYAPLTAQTLNNADPLVTTETGYGTSSAVSYGRVSELAQAKYLPELLAEQYAQGIKATYLYQLFDPYAAANPTSDFFNYYGLFRPDGTAKPAADVLHRMTTWLADPGLPFTPGSLDYQLLGAPTTIGSVLLQKSTGTFTLMMWNGVTAYNGDAGGDITTTPATVELDFLAAPTSLILRDTLTGVSTTINPTLHVSLLVPDHVVLLEIAGVAGSTAPVVEAPVVPGPAPIVTTIGVGSDTMVLKVSQDYWQASAQYIVTVDGVQQGGVQTARAFHSDKLSDTLTLRGDWSVGQHSVSLQLINDADGGAAWAGGNLYLNAATYDGASVAVAALGKVTSVSFIVNDTTVTPPKPVTLAIGIGTDALVLNVAQDAWQGSAQYTVAVDGVQQGGVQTASAYLSAGQHDTVTVLGDWALGPHSVTLSFINDAYSGPGMDRNLLLMGATYNGVAVGAVALGQVSVNTFAVTDVAPAPVSRTLGSGEDSLVLKLSQDAWQANAQYAVSVDGVQIGGTLLASGYHSVGQDDVVTLKGNWAAGQHDVTVAYLNDAYGGAPTRDRNLYLDDVNFNGVHINTYTGNIATANFQFTKVLPAPKTVNIGVGVDALVLNVAQDAWQGSAQYTVAVDGVQQGGVQTASAYLSAGQHDTVTVLGDWALGPHSVTLSFINDAYSGPGMDRNLLLMGATYNGVAVGAVALGQVSVNTFAVTDVAPAPVSRTLGSGEDSLVLKLSQDAWQANAQYAVSVDGVQIGGTLLASGYHSVGQDDVVTLKGNWAAGQHDVTVAYLNDAYGGAPTRDRNLYLDDVNFNGVHINTYTGNIATANFQFTKVLPAPKTVNIGVGVDALVLNVAQDAWQGSAQYTVAVDGVQQGGVQTASAYLSAGQHDTVTVLGDWALGPHSVTLSFINDAYSGPGMDRNLLLMGATYNGVAVGAVALGQVSVNTFAVTDVAPAPVSRTLGSGEDSLVLKLSQDAWQANAQYAVSVDGVQIGGTLLASGYHSVGQDDVVTLKGNWAAGQHDVTVAYLNDAYGGAPTRDRNLYLDDVNFNGVHINTYTGNIATANFIVTDTGAWR